MGRLGRRRGSPVEALHDRLRRVIEDVDDVPPGWRLDGAIGVVGHLGDEEVPGGDAGRNGQIER
jgi:hypothetical protein